MQPSEDFQLRIPSWFISPLQFICQITAVLSTSLPPSKDKSSLQISSSSPLIRPADLGLNLSGWIWRVRLAAMPQVPWARAGVTVLVCAPPLKVFLPVLLAPMSLHRRAALVALCCLSQRAATQWRVEEWCWTSSLGGESIILCSNRLYQNSISIPGLAEKGEDLSRPGCPWQHTSLSRVLLARVLLIPPQLGIHLEVTDGSVMPHRSPQQVPECQINGNNLRIVFWHRHRHLFWKGFSYISPLLLNNDLAKVVLWWIWQRREDRYADQIPIINLESDNE